MMIRSFALSGVAVVFSLTAAGAVEPTGKEVIDAFVATQTSDITEVTDVGAFEETDEGVTIASLTVSFTDDDIVDDEVFGSGKFELTYTGITLNGATSEGDVITVGEFVAEALSYELGEVSVTSGELAMSNVPLNPGDLGATMALFDRNYDTEYTIADVAISFQGAPVATIAEGTGDVISAASGGLSTSFDLQGINVPLSVLPPEATGMIAALGLRELAGSLSGTYVLSKAGAVDMEDMSVVLDNGAALGIDLSFSGLGEYFALLQSGLPDDLSDEDTAALFAEAALGGMAISVTDLGILQPAIGMFAAMSGTTPEGVQALAAMSIAGGFASVGAPELGTEVTQAVSTFLKDGGTIAIAAEPDSPIKFADMETLGANPAALIESLNIGVAVQ